jgi:hypothetical protein
VSFDELKKLQSGWLPVIRWLPDMILITLGDVQCALQEVGRRRWWSRSYISM